jgi:hypothetical protein
MVVHVNDNIRRSVVVVSKAAKIQRTIAAIAAAAHLCVSRPAEKQQNHWNGPGKDSQQVHSEAFVWITDVRPRNGAD